jgi:hypothetical protein
MTNFILPKNFWSKLEQTSLDVANIINGGLHINLNLNNCILEFRNINKGKYCVEKMQIEIREHYFQIKFDVMVNFSDFIMEDDENKHFCILGNKHDKMFPQILLKAKYHVNIVQRFAWTIKVLENIQDLFETN